MRRILTSVVLLVLLFPSLALGETVTWGDIVERGGLTYKKFTDIPFSGKVTGKRQGKIKNGKRVGPWVGFWDNGQISSKGTYKDGKREGPWVIYYKNGQLMTKGTYKNGRKEGLGVGFYPDGTLIEQWTGTYKDGKKVK